ncbi:translation initiation factor eIF-2B subunit delta [Marinobacter pelagius]|uniref:Translation initiation factor eIF-2B subunit delta n=1 Tax=Marinobacter pelagius TaxID=379482 RepID=A0A366GQL3_9GAMM|nr:initiation factor 2B [Marinobacter pelagius]RBP29717.1 translation initiation factor eIF-2B subunit delta [Marinobacter pelagius]
MDQRARAIVEAVRKDNQSGATQLAQKVLQEVRQWLIGEVVPANALEELFDDLTRTRPSMVPLANAVTRCRELFGPWRNSEKVSEQAVPVVASVLEQLIRANERVALSAFELVPENAAILTHSRSSQVLALFRLLAERQHPFSVICTQSSPGNEGFTLARELDELGVPVTLITDAQTGLFMAEADIVFSGCDTWLSDQHFVNKSGTYLLALAAREQGKPLWVLADSFKDSSGKSESVALEEMAPEELGGPTGAHIRTRNIYFETVPVRLVTGRVSDLGVFSFPAEPRR